MTKTTVFAGALVALSVASLIYLGFYMGRQGLPTMDGVVCQWVFPQNALGDLK